MYSRSIQLALYGLKGRYRSAPGLFQTVRCLNSRSRVANSTRTKTTEAVGLASKSIDHTTSVVSDNGKKKPRRQKKLLESPSPEDSSISGTATNTHKSTKSRKTSKVDQDLPLSDDKVESGIYQKSDEDNWDRGGRTEENSLTPLQEVIRRMVNDNPNCVSLVQVGSFYELYFHQAEEYAPKLGLKVALRNTKNFQVPMAGFPLYQLEKYVKILVHDLGESVAIIDQVGESSSYNGVSSTLPIHRRVSRIVTPGTLIDESFMNFNQNNYLLAISLPSQISGAAGGVGDSKYIELDPDLEVGLAWCDVSLGELNVQETNLRDLMSDITRINPSEIILPKSLEKNPHLREHSWLKDLNRFFVRFQREHTESLINLSESFFKFNKKKIIRELDGLSRKQQTSVQMILGYISINLPEHKPIFNFPRQHWSNKVLKMDPRTREALELNSRLSGSSVHNTLLSTIRRTLTDSGTRMLRQWISAPILDREELFRRQEFVSLFQSNGILRLRLREILSGIDDFVRSIQRLSLGVGDTSTNLLSIANGLKKAGEIGQLMDEEVQEEYRNLLLEELKSIPNLADKIFDTFDQNGGEDEDSEILEYQSSKSVETYESGPNLEMASKYNDSIEKYRLDKTVKRGLNTSQSEKNLFIVKKDFNEELASAHSQYSDLLVRESEVFDSIVNDVQASDPKLKIFPKSIHGKHVDILQIKGSENSIKSLLSADPVISILEDPFSIKEKRATSLIVKPAEWRSIKERLERQLYRIKDLEEKIISKLRRECLDQINEIRDIGKSIDFLDVTCGFSILAIECNLKRPKLVKGSKIEIEEGRHIVVEHGLKQLGEPFIPNDTKIDTKSDRLLVITGPNMGGKSTYLRQNALFVILAQIGSFVPAKNCKIGLVDRIFTRIGASDDISRDLSTFMVEMIETSNILENATESSLAIVDELGRGTSGKEGLSIAYGALVSLLNVSKCRTMFATHYGKELQRLLEIDNINQANVKYYKTGVKGDYIENKNGNFILDHKLRPGISERSYAFSVAQMAGFPNHALDSAKRAWDILQRDP